MDKKQNILDAAAYLFARNSFDGVGIRDISSRAKVNSAMISYYFGGKKKLLIEIYRHYASLLMSTSAETIDASNTVDEFCTNGTRRLITLARTNYDIFLTGLSLLNSTDPELKTIQDSLDDHFAAMSQAICDKFDLSIKQDKEHLNIFGNALLSMIFSHFLLGGEIEDDAYFDRYIDTVAPLMAHGMNNYKR